MRVTHVSTDESVGGAALATRRLHEGLVQLGVDSRMFVRRRRSGDSLVTDYRPSSNSGALLRRWLRMLRVKSAWKWHTRRRTRDMEYFSNDQTRFGSDALGQLPPCDVLNVHWTAGLMDFEQWLPRVPRSLPVVVTLHDMNAFTGGCHHVSSCENYRAQCGNCPQLHSTSERDHSRLAWQRKQRAYESIQPRERLTVVAPSRWLARMAAGSSLLGNRPIHVFPNSLDTGRFTPQDRQQARQLLGLPADSPLLLFVAASLTGRWKGLEYLAAAVASPALAAWRERALTVVTVGGADGPLPRFATRHVALGQIAEIEKLALVYNAADLFIMPSMEEALGNTAIESMACGTPVVAFASGGIPDSVRPGITGELVPRGDSLQLAHAIDSLLRQPDLRQKLGQQGRQVAVDEYDLSVQASAYRRLYATMLDQVATGTGRSRAA